MCGDLGIPLQGDNTVVYMFLFRVNVVARHLSAAIQEFPYSAAHRRARREHLRARRSSSASMLSPLIQIHDRLTGIRSLRD